MATSNYGFDLLTGSSKAGWNSINSLITSIDNQLYARVAVPGMIVIWDTTAGSVPTGWTDVTTTLGTAGFATPAGYKYIKKAST
jgi:hypothetical protein